MGCARMPAQPAQLLSDLHDAIGEPLHAQWLRATRRDRLVSEDMGEGFICGPGVEACSGCGCLSEYLCDAPMGEGKTCDLALCGRCRRQLGEFDLCPFHARLLDAKPEAAPPEAP